MKTKRILGAITAIAMSASAFAGLGTTALAAEYTDIDVDVSDFTAVYSDSRNYTTCSYDETSGVETITSTFGSAKTYPWAKLDLTKYYPESTDETVTSVTVSYTETLSSGGRTAIGFYDDDNATYLDTNAYQDYIGSAITYGFTAGSSSKRVYYCTSSENSSTATASYGTYSDAGFTTDSSQAVELTFDLLNHTVQGYIGSFEVDYAMAGDINSIDTMAFYSWSATTYEISNMKISYETTTAQYYTVTVNYVYEDESGEYVSIPGVDVDKTSVIENGVYNLTYVSPIYKEDYKYTYSTYEIVDDKSISSVTDDVTINVVYTREERGKYTATLRLMCGETIIDTQYKENVYKDEDATFYYPAYITDDNGYVIYECDEDTYAATVSYDETTESTIDIDYSAYSGTAQYFEGDGSIPQWYQENFSNGYFYNFITAESGTKYELLNVKQSGTYTLTVHTASRGYNSTNYVSIYVNDTLQTTGGDGSNDDGLIYMTNTTSGTTGTYTLELEAGDIIYGAGNNNRVGVDYALLEATTDLDPLITSVTYDTATLPATTETTYKEVVGGVATDTTAELAGKEVTSYLIAVRNWSSGIPSIVLNDVDETKLTVTDTNDGTPYYYTSGNYYYFVIQTYGIDATAKTVSLTGAADYTIQTN